jgi:glycolate oxidase iron-sulfur subunit
VSQHTSAPADALDFARRNIDAWLPHLDAGVEAIVMTASGCGVHVKEYGYYLRDDPAYAEKAKRIAGAVRDLSEVLRGEDLADLKPSALTNVAFQSPCSLQHGQKLSGVVEEILQKVGFSLVAVPDGHLCCGSAGTYSILHPVLARRLRRNKVNALSHNKPDVIATANVGCLTHLQAGTDLPVRHWIELLAD